MTIYTANIQPFRKQSLKSNDNFVIVAFEFRFDKTVQLLHEEHGRHCTQTTNKLYSNRAIPMYIE
jgi:hypothetical protein